MNSSNQGNSQGNSQANSQDSQQSASAGPKQGGDQGGQNFVLVDSEQELNLGDEPFILGEVRRVDRVRNRQGPQSG